MKALWIGVAGAAGALARYSVSLLIGPHSFPWATWVVNVVGSFALGAVMRIASERHWTPDVTTIVAVGFVGAFTTFSTFAAETVTLGDTDRLGTAAAYLVASIVVGLAACRLGMSIGARVARAAA